MAQHHYLINIPALAEFVFYCMKTASPEQKSRLTPTELRDFHTPKRMRNFADNESTERRMLLLARLGRSYVIQITSDKTELEELHAAIEEQYHFAGKRTQVVKLMKDQEVFFFSSRDVMMSSHMAAMNSQSQVYVLDHTYHKLHEKFGRIYEFGSDQQAMRSSMETVSDFADLALGVLNASDIVDSLVGVNDYEMRILLACMRHRNNFVSLETIRAAIFETARSKGVKKVCYSMAKRGYLAEMKGPADAPRTWNYTIMEKGIDAVMVYLKYIHHKTF